MILSCLMLLRSRFLNDSCYNWSASIPWQWGLELDNPGTSIWYKQISFACGSNAIPNIDRQVLEKVEVLWIASPWTIQEIVTLYVEQMWVHTYLKKHQLLLQVFMFQYCKYNPFLVMLWQVYGPVRNQQLWNIITSMHPECHLWFWVPFSLPSSA